jgi:hypothetical protein
MSKILFEVDCFYPSFVTISNIPVPLGAVSETTEVLLCEFVAYKDEVYLYREFEEFQRSKRMSEICGHFLWLFPDGSQTNLTLPSGHFYYYKKHLSVIKPIY